MSSFKVRLVACIAPLLLAFSLIPSLAVADVRGSDIVLGTSAETRGLVSAYLPNINAQYAYVVDEEGRVYFERDADEQTPIASVTKIMTAIVALDYGDPETTTITVNESAATIGESSAALNSGDSMTLEAAIKAMMINSGNDAAYAIGESMGDSIGDVLRNAGDENVPSNSMEAFVYAMNKKASELGMANSLFANTHGLDFGEYDEDMHSSAHDVAIMCQTAMDNELFREVVSTDATTISVIRDGLTAQVSLESTDILLGSYEGACGIKTGYTDKAGYCFAGAFVQEDGSLLYAIVLASDSEDQRFSDATTLLEWVESNTISYPLVHSTQTVSYTSDGTSYDVPVVAKVAHGSWTDKTFKATLADPEAYIEVFRLEGNISQEMEFYEISGNVKVGQKVGIVNFYQHNQLIDSEDIVAAENCAAPSIFEGIGIWWTRLISGITGEQTIADSTVVNTTPLIYGSNATIDTDS